ncbi:IS630 transposase-related protein, partial [Neisseria dentiae]
MAYPIELRQKAIEYYRQCQNASQVCRVYGISDKTL